MSLVGRSLGNVEDEPGEEELREQMERDITPSCPACGVAEGDCRCCLECGGEGFVEDGGCGGGCEFCRPFPLCSACNGKGVRP